MKKCNIVQAAVEDGALKISVLRRIIEDGYEEIEFEEGLDIEELNLSGTSRLVSLKNIPKRLTTLILRNSGIRTLDLAGVGALEILNLHNTSQLESVKNLPERVSQIYLDKSGIRNLDLAGLVHIGELDLQECSSLQFTAELREQLEDLESRCTIRYPAHYRTNNEANDAAFASFEEICKDHEGLGSIKEVFQRFLVEAKKARGGAEYIASEVQEFLEFVKAHPESLQWIDGIAANYRSGCVNQPVAGFAKIMSWINVAKQETLQEKFDATRIVRAQKYLLEFVAEKKLVGKEVEVELGNALLKEVYDLLPDDKITKKPWSGIPKKIAYEDTIKSKLTEELIKEAKQKMQRELRATNQELFDFLCINDDQDIAVWSNIAFAPEVEKIKSEFQKRLGLVQEISDVVKEINSKSMKDRHDTEFRRKIQEFEKSLDDEDNVFFHLVAEECLKQKPEDRIGFLEKKLKQLGSDLDEELTKMNKEKTGELLGVKKAPPESVAAIAIAALQIEKTPTTNTASRSG